MLRSRLFVEFCHAPQKPAFFRYVEAYTTPQERRNGLGPCGYTPAYERTLNELYRAFTGLLVDQKRGHAAVPPHYLTHSFADMPLVGLLNKFDQQSKELVNGKDSREYSERVATATYLLNLVNNYCTQNEWPQSATNELTAVLLERVYVHEHNALLWSDTPNTSIGIVGLFEQVATTLPRHRPTLPTPPPGQKPKRTTTQRQNAATLLYFRREVRNGVEAAMLKRIDPQQKEILKAAFRATVDRKSIGAEKLRKDIPPAMQSKIYGIIYREELEVKRLYMRP